MIRRLPARAPRALLVAPALCAALTAGSCRPSAEEPLTLLTFNVRYDDPDDRAHPWAERRSMVASTVRFLEADAAGFQEVLHPQLHDLAGLLPGYRFVAAGRDDGRERGEACPIFYRKDRLRLLRSGTFWLSDDPARVGGVGWDAACPRIATWGDFEDRRTGRCFVLFNTHFDHVGETARLESARLLLRSAAAIGSGRPVAVVGDFNCEQTEPAYRTLVGGWNGIAGFGDARDLSAAPPYGPASTFNGFSAGPRGPYRIDHVFLRGTGPVVRCGVVAGDWDGRFASDHNPVLAEVVIGR